jgi:hypothetical protein
MLCPEHENREAIDIISSRLYGVSSARLPTDAKLILALMVQAIGKVADGKLDSREAEAIAALGETGLKALHVGYSETQRRFDRKRIEAPPPAQYQRVIEGPSLEEMERSTT